LSVVIDASAALGWVFEDETSEFTNQLFDYVRDFGGHVTSFWHLEVGNAVLSAVKRNRIDLADAYERLSLIAALPIVADLESPERAWGRTIRLAQEHQLTTYDAAYFELALRLGSSLASFDKALCRASRQVNLPLYFDGIVP
jgi:predicted nucleic acid-binding protein